MISAIEAMRLALVAGEKGAGFVSPNPLVGCTILDRDFNVLAVGYHHRVGDAHAEIDALRQITNPELLKGAHVFVTLEPCAHQGRTPSCARTLAPLGLASVTYAVEDPNPLVAGQGAAILREAGVSISLLAERQDIDPGERASLVARAEKLAEIFLHNFRVREPFIAVKVGSSLDGYIALTSGESKWITSEEARLHSHGIRARYDAVAVGVNTLFNDDPALNVRHPSFPDFKNRAVVLDPEAKSLEFLRGSRLLKVRSPETVFVVVSERIWCGGKAPLAQELGCKILVVPEATPGEFLMPALLEAFREAGLASVMIEGGAQTISTFFHARKVQRLHLYLAPVLLGGRNSVSWSAGFGIDTMASKISLLDSERAVLGRDLYWTGRF